MKLIDADELRDKLTPDVAIELARAAVELAAQAGRFERPQRSFYPVDDLGSRFGVMPMILKDPPLLGLKVINIFPGNATIGKPTHVGIYQLFSGKTGELIALMDANVLTGIRTAAMTAFATRHIASDLTDRIAIIGTGDQAAWHARLFGTLFKPAEIFVSGRSRDAEARLVAKLRQEMPTLKIAAKETESAVREATLICTVTSSATPVVRKEWLAERVHINAIGSHSADCAELDEAIVENAICFTDDQEAFQSHCREYLTLVSEGRPYPDRTYGLDESFAGKGRVSGTTVYKSFGTAIQDIVFAAYISDIDLLAGQTTTVVENAPEAPLGARA